MKLIRQGKVKDVYAPEEGTYLLFRFSNRISVFDKIIPTEIPQKGETLCRTAAFWFKRAEKMGFKTHFLECPTPSTMKVKRVEVIRDYSKITPKSRSFLIPLEFIARYYVAGSLHDRMKRGKIDPKSIGFNGVPEYGERLPEPFIEVTTKLEEYDRPISKKEALEMSSLTPQEYDEIVEIILKVDEEIERRARAGGLIHVDGKKEFGMDEERSPMLLDTFGTADEDRFWDAKLYEEGQFVELSKEFVRKYYRESGYYERLREARERGEEEPEIPPLPEDMVGEVRRLYIELYERLTGERF
ncbi:MAG: phosphoribosylaminoimidazolesuccinocarboxamide synthase [Thermoplasmata archaeon]|nr:phosphoribosylaminoimidazolesuccinocarboxamide synthase [Thermoplasmata archaeon]